MRANSERTSQGGDVGEVVGRPLAEDQGSRSAAVAARILDLGLVASLDGGWEGVDLNGESSSNEGRACEDRADETHCDVGED